MGGDGGATAGSKSNTTLTANAVKEETAQVTDHELIRGKKNMHRKYGYAME